MKLKLPKFKLNLKLPLVLWILFLAVVLAEAVVLFIVLNIAFGETGADRTVTVQETSQVDLPAYEETLEWVESRESYELPEYSLETTELGRENPFLE